MKTLRILRLEESINGYIGVLLIDGEISCFTLQPDAKDIHFQIPQGSYLCRRFHGTKYPDTFEVVVPGHTALLFHSGNTEYDTQGCILLGESVGYLKGVRAVLTSGTAFCEFMDTMGSDQEANLFIEDIRR